MLHECSGRYSVCISSKPAQYCSEGPSQRWSRDRRRDSSWCCMGLWLTGRSWIGRPRRPVAVRGPRRRGVGLHLLLIHGQEFQQWMRPDYLSRGGWADDALSPRPFVCIILLRRDVEGQGAGGSGSGSGMAPQCFPHSLPTCPRKCWLK